MDGTAPRRSGRGWRARADPDLQRALIRAKLLDDVGRTCEALDLLLPLLAQASGDPDLARACGQLLLSGDDTGALAYTAAALGERDDRADRRHYVRWPGEEPGTQLEGPVADWPSVLIGP